MYSEVRPFVPTVSSTPMTRRAVRAIERNRAELAMKEAAAEALADLTRVKAGVLSDYVGSVYPLIARDAEARRRVEQAYPEVAGDMAYLSRAMMGGLAAITDNLIYELGRI